MTYFKRPTSQMIKVVPNKIFQEKPELYQLYKELVVSNIITAQEFWENQKVNMKTEDMKQQEVGIASGIPPFCFHLFLLFYTFFIKSFKGSLCINEPLKHAP